MFDRIYKKHNNSLYSTDDIKSRIWETISRILESLRKERGKDVVAALPLLYGWSMALWNQVGINMAEALWYKYPAVCPYCLVSENCLCITGDLRYDPYHQSLNSFRRDVSSKPVAVSEWQAMFAKIYGRVNKIKPRAALFFHFVEEVGEVSRELRHRNQQGVRDESTDMFAQLLAFCTKLDVDIDGLVWQKYPGECDVCRQEKCICDYD